MNPRKEFTNRLIRLGIIAAFIVALVASCGVSIGVLHHNSTQSALEAQQYQQLQTCIPNDSSGSNLDLNVNLDGTFKSAGDFTAVTWNTLFFNGAGNVAGGIREFDRAGADIIALQELTRNDRRRAVARVLGPGWGVIKYKNAVPIYWRRSKFELVDPVKDQGSQWVFQDTRVEGGASGHSISKRPINWVRLRSKATGGYVTFVNNHIVPTIERGGRLDKNKPRRVALYHDQMNTGFTVIDRAKQHTPVLTFGDYNFDARKDARVKASEDPYVLMAKHGMYSNWRTLGLIGKGTSGHKQRYIDYQWASRTTAVIPVLQKILPKHGSDHSPVAVTYSGSKKFASSAAIPPKTQQTPQQPAPTLAPTRGPPVASMQLKVLSKKEYPKPAPVKLNKALYGKVPELRTHEQQVNAETIVGVGVARGLSTKGIELTLAVAIHESNLHNYLGGDRTSVGLFQQQTSVRDGHGGYYWGSAQQAHDPVYATNRFIDELLRKVGKKKLESTPLYDLALLIQNPNRNAYHSRWFSIHPDKLASSLVNGQNGDAYANGDQSTGLAQEPTTSACPGPNGTGDPGANGTAGTPNANFDAMWAAATSQIGAKYRWATTVKRVVKKVVVNGKVKKEVVQQGAFDCSSFTTYAFKAGGVKLTPFAASQLNETKKYSVKRSELQKGDLMFFGSGISHVGIYAGDNKILHAPNPSKLVGIYDMGGPDGWYWRNFKGATRPINATQPSTKSVQPGEDYSAGKWTEPSWGVTSSYGRRFHPVKHVWKLHDGTDYGGACGAPIRAIHAGKITKFSFESYGGGTMTEISHGRYHSVYEHQVRRVAGLHEGQVVLAGQVLGYVGATGAASGCHLHLTIKDTNKPDHGWGSQTINPRAFFKMINQKNFDPRDL